MKNILIAEDDPASRELFLQILETAGYQVIEVCDGSQVLQKLNQTKPDLIVLDIRMPGLDGFSVLNQLRQDPRLASVPVIAITAHAMRGDREKILAAGFNEYLSKPISSNALKAKVKELLG